MILETKNYNLKKILISPSKTEDINFKITENKPQVVILEYCTHKNQTELINIQTLMPMNDEGVYQSINFKHYDDFYLENINEDKLGKLYISKSNMNIETFAIDLKVRIILPYNYYKNQEDIDFLAMDLNNEFKLYVQDYLSKIKNHLMSTINQTDIGKVENGILIFMNKSDVGEIINRHADNTDKKCTQMTMEMDMSIIKCTYNIENNEGKDKDGNKIRRTMKRLIYNIDNIFINDSNYQSFKNLEGKQLIDGDLNKLFFLEIPNEEPKLVLFVPNKKVENRDIRQIKLNYSRAVYKLIQFIQTDNENPYFMINNPNNPYSEMMNNSYEQKILMELRN